MPLQHPDAFYQIVRNKLFKGVLSPRQFGGTKFLLDAWDGHDIRWVAYALATAYWETDQTMEPVRENNGKAYGRPSAWYWKAVGPYGQVYYGRGYPQLTGLTNYQWADDAVPGFDLVRTPDNMLKPEVAVAVMMKGMIGGHFTGVKLADFFNDRLTDWVGARRIINGNDHALQIALIAKTFNEALVKGGYSR